METVLLTILILIVISVVGYIFLYNNLQAYNIKINEAESIIDDLLRKKYDTLDNMKVIILKETDLLPNTFEIFEKIKNVNISSFELDRKLTEIGNLIEQIKNDYKALEDNEDFSNYFEDVYEINERLEATKSFYNKYTFIHI